MLIITPYYLCTQIRHATVDKLLERLTDLRFLSIDFLNTFLLTYKVFTDSETILKSLRTTVMSSCMARDTEYQGPYVYNQLLYAPLHAFKY